MNRVSWAAVREGVAAMVVNPLRTALSTLGVVMGIASVIATLSMTDGVELFLREQIAAQTDVQAVSVSSKTQIDRDGFSFPNRSYAVFSQRDGDELQRFLGRDDIVTMSVGGVAVVTTPFAPAHAVSVMATLANFLVLGSKTVQAGRYFSEVEVNHNAPVIVLSHKLAVALSPDGRPASMLGREVRIRGRAMTTIGVMPPFLGERNFGVFLPLRGAEVALGARQLTPSIQVRAPSVEMVEATRLRIVEWLAGRIRDWNAKVEVNTSLLRLEQTRSALLIMKLVFATFASIALVVGGVGIMNILLANVAERTREIGVRKAMGARRRDILFQFLAESVAIATLGTSVGTALGLGVAFGTAAVVRWQVPGAHLQAAITVETLLTAIISAAVIGLTFGTLPAVRAAKLSPVDAIRHE